MNFKEHWIKMCKKYGTLRWLILVIYFPVFCLLSGCTTLQIEYIYGANTIPVKFSIDNQGYEYCVSLFTLGEDPLPLAGTENNKLSYLSDSIFCARVPESGVGVVVVVYNKYQRVILISNTSVEKPISSGIGDSTKSDEVYRLNDLVDY